MLLELLSHQNFADMKYGLDPSFRFTVSRSVYKGVLKYLSARYGCSYVVQPLPVKAFAAEVKDGNAILSWENEKDPDEPTAVPTGYILYTRENDGAFDNGVRLEEVSQEGDRCSVSIPIRKGRLYSFKVVAFNEGGKSFPSEVLAAGVPAADAPKNILVVNNFTRISAPAWFDTPNYSSTGTRSGPMTTTPASAVPIPTAAAGLSRATPSTTPPSTAVSCWKRAMPSVPSARITSRRWRTPRRMRPSTLSAESRSRRESDAAPFRTATPSSRPPCRTPSGSMRAEAVPSSSPAWDQVYPGTYPIKGADQTKSFIQEVLGYKWITNFGDVSGIIVPKAGAPVQMSDPMRYNRLFDEHVYRVENPDGIEPASKYAQTFLRYAGTEIPAATVFDNGKHRVIACGFPLETLTTEGALEAMLLVSMKYLVPEVL